LSDRDSTVKMIAIEQNFAADVMAFEERSPGGTVVELARHDNAVVGGDHARQSVDHVRTVEIGPETLGAHIDDRRVRIRAHAEPVDQNDGRENRFPHHFFGNGIDQEFRRDDEAGSGAEGYREAEPRNLFGLEQEPHADDNNGGRAERT
jgi:hypothetical protein